MCAQCTAWTRWSSIRTPWSSADVGWLPASRTASMACRSCSDGRCAISDGCARLGRRARGIQLQRQARGQTQPPRLGLAEAEKCESQLHAMIDQVSAQQDKIAALEEMKVRQDEERVHLKMLIQDLEKRSLQTLINKNVVPVAAVVIMACNRPDYLQRTVESILKYQKAVASKFPLFISQDGTNGEVKKKALSYNQITFMQHVDLEGGIQWCHTDQRHGTKGVHGFT